MYRTPVSGQTGSPRPDHLRIFLTPVRLQRSPGSSTRWHPEHAPPAYINICYHLPVDKIKGQADEDQGRRQRGYSVRRTHAQYRLDPSSHIVNSVPRIVLFVSLSPACPLGSLFKEHQGEGTGGGTGRSLDSFLSALSASSLLRRSFALPSSGVETQL